MSLRHFVENWQVGHKKCNNSKKFEIQSLRTTNSNTHTAGYEIYYKRQMKPKWYYSKDGQI